MGIRGRKCTGFTLLELVVATAITACVLMICYQLLGSTLSAADRVERRTRPDKIGEAIMALLRRDLKAAVWYALGDEVFLLENRGEGTAARDEIHFFTTARPIYAVESDLGFVPWTGVTSVGYTLQRSETAGCFTLFRRESVEIGERPFETGTYFEIYDKVKFLEILVFDGTEWLDEWDSVLRREQYEGDLKDAIDQIISEATRIPTTRAAPEGERPAAVLRRLAPQSGGLSSRRSSRRAGPGSVAAEEDQEQRRTFLPLPNWAVPQAVRIELGIVVGSERGVYREGSGSRAPARVYTFSATVPVASAAAVHMAADVPGLTGVQAVAAGPAPQGAATQEGAGKGGSSTRAAPGGASSGRRVGSFSRGRAGGPAARKR